MAEVRIIRRLAAEFVGTAALVVCGPGTATATTMIAAGAGTDTSSGLNAVTALTQLGITALAFTMVIIAMIYTIGHISGCHINPAVTLALAITKKTRWNEVPGYLSAQLAGAITGAFATWAILQKPGLDTGLGTLHYPPGHTTSAFFAELIGTFLLILVVLATTTDSRATPGWHGLAIAAIVQSPLAPAMSIPAISCELAVAVTAVSECPCECWATKRADIPVVAAASKADRIRNDRSMLDHRRGEQSSAFIPC